MSIELEPLGELRIEIAEQVRVDGGPLGNKMIGVARSCHWSGGPVTASQVGPPAHDWLTIDADGHGHVDARAVMRTGDGATILIRYGGRLSFGPDGPTVVIAPTFETGDDRYRWLNHVQAIATGRRIGTALVYELYAVR